MGMGKIYAWMVFSSSEQASNVGWRCLFCESRSSTTAAVIAARLHALHSGGNTDIWDRNLATTKCKGFLEWFRNEKYPVYHLG